MLATGDWITPQAEPRCASGTRTSTEHSHQHLIAACLAQRPSPQSRLICVAHRPLSADFHARGQLLKVPDEAALQPYLDDRTPDFVPIHDGGLPLLTDADRQRLEAIDRSGAYQLLRERPH